MKQPATRSIAIVGTDTGIGKTLVAGALLLLLKERGSVCPFKPAETGCSPSSPPDGLFLRAVAGLNQLEISHVVPHCFSLPASPLVAASRQHQAIQMDPILDHHDHLASQFDFVVIEGAGGLLVPYGPDWTFADLLENLRPAIIVVASTGLGTMNHTLLTVSELRHRNLEPLGIVFNHPNHTTGPEEDDTPQVICRFARLPNLGIIPHLSPEQMAAPPIAAAAARQALHPDLPARLFPSPQP